MPGHRPGVALQPGLGHHGAAAQRKTHAVVLELDIAPRIVAIGSPLRLEPEHVPVKTEHGGHVVGEDRDQGDLSAHGGLLCSKNQNVCAISPV